MSQDFSITDCCKGLGATICLCFIFIFSCNKDEKKKRDLA